MMDTMDGEIPALDAIRVGPGLPGGYTNAYVAVLGEVMVLHNAYPPEQTWFPFMSGCVLNNQSEIRTPWSWIDCRSAKNVQTDLDQINEYPCDFCTYVPDERDVPQRVLPFHEYKRVKDEDFTFLLASEFASFDRDEEGKLFVYKFDYKEYDQILEWLQETCQGRFALQASRVYIEREEDALAVRLRVS